MQTKDVIYFLVLFICISMIIGLLFYMKSETAQCVKNPFIYGASTMKNVECSCIQKNNQLCPAQFSFNDTTFTADVTRCGSSEYIAPKLDLSNFNLTG